MRLWVLIVTASDYSLQVRRAVLIKLKSDVVFSGLVGGRVYSESPPAKPTFPFARWGFAVSTPEGWSCTSGASMSCQLSVFSKSSGTDECARLIRNAVRVLDLKPLVLEADQDSGIAATAFDVQVTQTQIIRDTAEAECYHGIISLSITVADNF